MVRLEIVKGYFVLISASIMSILFKSLKPKLTFVFNILQYTV